MHTKTLKQLSALLQSKQLSSTELTGHFLLHRVFSQANVNLPEPRLRLEEKFRARLSSAP